MSWNYRIIHYANGAYGLHEVHYDDEGNISSRTLEPISFYSDQEEGPKGIRSSLRLALADASRLPVVEELPDEPSQA
jgi:hypothetical protein